MHTLIITTHPSKKGHTHRIAARYKEVAESRGTSVLVMDLYQPEWAQDFLVFEDPREMNERDKAARIQAEMLRADELVFVSPMWWGSVPARMKNFFDHNITPGFAYTYKDGTHGLLRLPKGLLSGKRVKFIMTADGPTWTYWFLKPFFTFAFKWWVVRFCGMRLASFTIIGDMYKRARNPKEIDLMIEKISKLV